MLDRFFKLTERQTTIRTELLGGTTTFATMAYIIVVNPAILSAIHIPVGPSTVATILVAVVGSMFMGLYANRPLAVAPYMGENAFLAYGIQGLSVPVTWQLRLGSVFVAGLAFIVFTFLGIRSWLANAISSSMKHSFAAGIGLFLAFLGLFETGIVAAGIGVPVRLGDLRDVKVLLAIGGFIVTAGLMAWRIKGAILFGIVATAATGFALGEAELPTAIVAMPFVGEYDLSPIAFQLDIAGVFDWEFLPILLTLFLMGFLDTLGTLVGVGAAGDMLDKDGNFPQMERPMLVDAATCVFSSVVGSSTSGAYIESAAGVREGARTGLASVMTALLFAVSIFFIPLVQPLQSLKHAYGPALIAVGVLMFGTVRHIDWDDFCEAAPAFVTLTLIAFSYSISNGLTAGLIAYPLIKLLAGRWRELSIGSLVLAAICMTYYVFGLRH